MIHLSPLPDLDSPKCNILDYLFPEGEPVSDLPVWIDAAKPEKHLSPKSVLEWAKRLIIGLETLGLRTGDVCMIHSPNHIFVPAAYLGIAGGCHAFSAANPLCTVDELVYQLKHTGAKCIFAHSSLVEKDLEAAKKVGFDPKRIFQFSDEPCIDAHGIRDWRSMLGTVEQAMQYRWRRMTPQESVQTVATINFSSGTTGMPKGVMISHHSLVANVEQSMAVRWPGLDIKAGGKPEERWVGFLPLYHAYGQLYANLICAKTLIPIYIMKQFQYTDFLRHIQDFRITHLQVAPPILVMMSKRPEAKEHDLRSLRGILCGGAPLSKELQNKIARRFNVEVVQGWGMTELTCAAVMPLEMRDDGNVGQLIPNNKLRLVDDDGKDVGFDTPGEMLIQGPNVMLGYWKNDAATRDTIDADSWLRTGDIGVINKERYIWIVDRKKELIKVNALQVAPAELEALLLENEHIADAATCGIQLRGEEWPRAYVVLTDEGKRTSTTKQIQDWFRPRVAKHKALVGGVKFVDEIPRLQSGKIQRKVLREWVKRDAAEVETMFDRAKL